MTLRLCKLVVVSNIVTDIYEVMLNPGIIHRERFRGHIDCINFKNSELGMRDWDLGVTMNRMELLSVNSAFHCGICSMFYSKLDPLHNPRQRDTGYGPPKDIGKRNNRKNEIMGLLRPLLPRIGS